MPPKSRATAASSKPNPFDSDSDSEFTSKPSRKSSAPSNGVTSLSSYSVSSRAKNRYKNDFSDTGGFENQSVQELENYAAYKAEETTDAVNGCLRIAENIREDAKNTLITLHKQGEQIRRTHETAANIDQDLSKSESLLGSLGGFFSKPWKPKKTRQIKGPSSTAQDDSFQKRVNHIEQREKLGLSEGKSNPRSYADPTNAMEKVQVEKEKQDDALNDLSDVLGQLKGMAVDMGSEIDRQNTALDDLQGDVDELTSRVKGANQRARKLVSK